MNEVDVINKLDDTLKISRGVEEILMALSRSGDLALMSNDDFSYGINLMYEVLYHCNCNLQNLRKEIKEN